MEIEANERRRKLVPISRSILRSMLEKDHETVYRIDGLPENYEIVTVNTSYRHDGLYVVVESQEFDPVPDSMEIPIITPTISQRFIQDEAREEANHLFEELFEADYPDAKSDLIDDMTEVIKEFRLEVTND